MVQRGFFIGEVGNDHRRRGFVEVTASSENELVRFPARPNLRRLVFWVALGIMLVGAVTGLVWALIEHEFGRGPLAFLTIGLSALLVALVFGLLHFTNPTFHPESHLFSWSDVDELRGLSQRLDIERETSEWARSLADRIAVVLPGRPQSELRPPRPRRSGDRTPL
jgi:hypothetical protein